jgi:hypothetical protein
MQQVKDLLTRKHSRWQAERLEIGADSFTVAQAVPGCTCVNVTADLPPA